MSTRGEISTVRALLRWWRLVALLTVLGAVIGYVTGSMTRPVYQSTTSILVGQLFRAVNVSQDEIEASQQLALTYADVIRRQPILQRVVGDLALDTSWQDLREGVHVDLSPDNPQLIVVSVEAASPEEAARVAGEIADQVVALKSGSELQGPTGIQKFLSSRLRTLQREIRQRQRLVGELEQELAITRGRVKIRNLQLQIETHERLIVAWQDNYSSLLEFLEPTGSPNDLEVLEEAEVDPTPVRPDILMNSSLAAGVGLFLAVGLVHLLEPRALRRSTRPVRTGNGLRSRRRVGDAWRVLQPGGRWSLRSPPRAAGRGSASRGRLV